MTPHCSLERKIVEKALQEHSRPNMKAVSQASCKVHCQLVGQPVFSEQQGRSTGRQNAVYFLGLKSGESPVHPYVAGVLPSVQRGPARKDMYQLQVGAVTVPLSHITPPPYVISRLGVHMLWRQKPDRCASENTLHAASDHTLPAET